MKIETMSLLTEAELRAGVRNFSETRDRYAEEGRPALAGVFAYLAAAFKAEQTRRKLMFRAHTREMAGAEARWSWEDEYK